MMDEYGLGYSMMGTNHIGLGLFFMLIFWGLIFFVIYWVINSNKLGTNKTPKDILNLRLAKGEISKKEYKDLLIEINKK